MPVQKKSGNLFNAPYIYPAIGIMSTVFVNGSIPGRVKTKPLKMVLDAALLNTQYYKVRIKDKVEQSKERSSALPQRLGVVVIEKGAFGSPSTIVTNFTLLLYIYIYYICVCVCVCILLSKSVEWTPIYVR